MTLHFTGPFPYRPTAPQPAARAASFWRAAGAWLDRRRQFRRSVAGLSSLDDRLLADLGISRDEVRRVAGRGRLPGWE
ncbi:DUF1127 domain-containing protein [Nitratireductor mangrovi]|uniref:DUF1127 domain-containing protein n=1 Tax=Nitratireductor mangrovi TaxID=2599600 RepID=A0A5B8KVI2_9HYPH|nr:DUF1127 domain-containing protein [Nitratireductor mangrovi]QDY99653.1 DUF1127 domain-containing protein [Nitratireductor mangrovi]